MAGQAKRRGPREQRVAEGVAKREAAARQRQEAEAARLAALTPAERAAESQARQLLGMAYGLTYGLLQPRPRG